MNAQLKYLILNVEKIWLFEPVALVNLFSKYQHLRNMPHQLPHAKSTIDCPSEEDLYFAKMQAPWAWSFE